MTTTIEPTGTHATGVKLSRLLWVSLLAMLAAAAANLALYFVAGRIAPEVTAWPGSGPTQVVGAPSSTCLSARSVCGDWPAGIAPGPPFRDRGEHWPAARWRCRFRLHLATARPARRLQALPPPSPCA